MIQISKRNLYKYIYINFIGERFHKAISQRYIKYTLSLYFKGLPELRTQLESSKVYCHEIQNCVHNQNFLKFKK